MNTAIIIVFAVCCLLRAYSVAVSAKNIKALRKAGATEYGKFNSNVLFVLHVAFYVGVLIEGYCADVRFDWITVIGAALFLFSKIMLFFVVRQLSPLWTVRLYIAKNHALNKSALFKYFRHPNYFLNILPELIGLVLIMKAWTVLCVGLPIYLVSLAVRIAQEEKLMKSVFPEY